MAEINLERKRGPGAWVWIIALVVLAVILWALFFRHTERRAASRGEAAIVAVSGAAVRTSGPPGAQTLWLAPAHKVGASGCAA